MREQKNYTKLHQIHVTGCRPHQRASRTHQTERHMDPQLRSTGLIQDFAVGLGLITHKTGPLNDLLCHCLIILIPSKNKSLCSE